MTGWKDTGDYSALSIKLSVDASDPILTRKGNISRRSLIGVLEILVHEMAHAYLTAFIYSYDESQRALGDGGHGPT